ncbi:aspartate/glutamate racemase family protein [Aeromicrobium chenweiae]|uniref:Aspartate/glutamate racemase n=1 Tax=Aeromicrobium chenweiae TaxID=2079793 RepID=A0A2S0WR56_9ACTN|nr:aspartate/glutamate racemase family protein [Aeromicrobium chenweiae]AWB93843.1 aspartate/glutamate racemase [Aeromicrobium chenweiae]TGN30888.1 aspartate/glutamate racemase family protein [Aeromicrobium chenweiae]
MRTIGLIGGMSWVSTVEYYRLMNESVAARLGGLHSARILLESVDFADIERLKLADRWDLVADHLAAAGRRLEAAGADLVVLCTNTMHHVAAEIESAITVPFVHIADTTAEAIGTAGLCRVGLLGTAFTMEQSFYVDRVATHGIEVLVPPEDDRTRISAIVYDELCHDVMTAESKAFYLAATDRLVARGAEGIILGCTEIELLIGAADLEVPVFPTTALHVEAAVDLALS